VTHRGPGTAKKRVAPISKPDFSTELQEKPLAQALGTLCIESKSNFEALQEQLDGCNLMLLRIARHLGMSEE
jgi:hypothetical protein